MQELFVFVGFPWNKLLNNYEMRASVIAGNKVRNQLLCFSRSDLLWLQQNLGPVALP